MNKRSESIDWTLFCLGIHLLNRRLNAGLRVHWMVQYGEMSFKRKFALNGRVFIPFRSECDIFENDRYQLHIQIDQGACVWVWGGAHEKLKRISNGEYIKRISTYKFFERNHHKTPTHKNRIINTTHCRLHCIVFNRIINFHNRLLNTFTFKYALKL